MPSTSRGSRRDFAALEARRYEAARLFARLTHVRYHPGHVWYILRRLGWSLQRPTRQARERDEAAIAQWKRERWPQVKKTRGAAGLGSSSKTRVASRIDRSSAAPGPRAATRRF